MEHGYGNTLFSYLNIFRLASMKTKVFSFKVKYVVHIVINQPLAFFCVSFTLSNSPRGILKSNFDLR